MKQHHWTTFCLLIAISGMLGYGEHVEADCPESCLCVQLQVLCEQSSLNKLPSPLSSATEHLALRKTNISVIPPDAFQGLHNMKRVVLDSNQIREVAPYAFRGLANLEELSVQDNPLPYLATHSFSDLVNITNLFLGYNKIAAIAMNAFANTHHVRSISLTGNPLKTIQSGAFANLHGVDILYLPSGVEEIEPDSFNGLSNVSMIRLTNLRLHQMPSCSFRGLSNVASLNIRDSRITVIKSRAFHGLSSVDYLTLENNTIDTLEAYALQGMKSVSVLGIHRNRIKLVEPHALDDIGEVRKIRFVHNWFSCDCRLRWVAESHRSSVPNLLIDNLCLSPDHHAHKNASVVYAEVMAQCTARTTPSVVDEIEQETVEREREEKEEDIESVEVKEVVPPTLAVEIVDEFTPINGELGDFITTPETLPEAEANRGFVDVISWIYLITLAVLTVVSVS